MQIVRTSRKRESSGTLSLMVSMITCKPVYSLARRMRRKTLITLQKRKVNMKTRIARWLSPLRAVLPMKLRINMDKVTSTHAMSRMFSAFIRNRFLFGAEKKRTRSSMVKNGTVICPNKSSAMCISVVTSISSFWLLNTLVKLLVTLKSNW